MEARRADASSRTFFDQYVSVGSRASARSAWLIPHDRKPSSRSPTARQAPQREPHPLPKRRRVELFSMPGLHEARSEALPDPDDAPTLYGQKGNVHDRSRLGFGRNERLKASDKALDQLIAELETTTPLRLKPAPPSWHGRASIIQSSHRSDAAKAHDRAQADQSLASRRRATPTSRQSGPTSHQRRTDSHP